MADKDYLKNVYGLKSVADTQNLYDDWSQSYDADMVENQYATPGRIAATLADLVADKSTPILDFGCGTGISGAALKGAGFQVIDGCDLSQDMLDQAAAGQTYRKTWQTDPNRPFGVEPGTYGAIAAAGVISIGAAPPETLDLLVRALAPGGFLVFSFNDHTLEDPRFETRVDECIATGDCALLSRQDGEHLPGIGLRSTVFVLRRL